jgi:hypothetical protein
MTGDPDALARIVHETRRSFGAALDRPMTPAPWEERHPRQQELDRQIAAAVAAQAVKDAGFDQAALAAEVIRLRVRLDDIVNEVCRRVARKCEERGNALPPGVERNAWLNAAAVALEAREGQERSGEKEGPQS